MLSITCKSFFKWTSENFLEISILQLQKIKNLLWKLWKKKYIAFQNGASYRQKDKWVNYSYKIDITWAAYHRKDSQAWLQCNQQQLRWVRCERKAILLHLLSFLACWGKRKEENKPSKTEYLWKRKQLLFKCDHYRREIKGKKSSSLQRDFKIETTLQIWPSESPGNTLQTSTAAFLSRLEKNSIWHWLTLTE